MELIALETSDNSHLDHAKHYLKKESFAEVLREINAVSGKTRYSKEASTVKKRIIALKRKKELEEQRRLAAEREREKKIDTCFDSIRILDESEGTGGNWHWFEGRYSVGTRYGDDILNVVLWRFYRMHLKKYGKIGVFFYSKNNAKRWRQNPIGWSGRILMVPVDSSPQIDTNPNSYK